MGRARILAQGRVGSPEMAETGRYLYAVTRGVDAAALEGVEALSGGSLELLEHRDLVAVLSTVDLREYGEEGLRDNLEELEWLERVARTHDAVIKAVAGLGPVAPMRLATIFLSDASVRQRLDEWYLALEQVLERVQGRLEWSVKVLSGGAGPEDVADAQDRPTTGAEYLRQKKARLEQRVARDAESQEQAQSIHRALSGRAVAGRLLPAQDPRLTGHQGTMLLNAAYLVEADEGDAFAEAVDASAAMHPELVVDVRGPWPPYSFAMLEQR